MYNQSIPFPALEACIGKTLESVPKAGQAWVLMQLLKHHQGDIIAIAESDDHADSLETLCKQYHDHPEDILQFVKYDTEPYEKKTPHMRAMAKRLQVLYRLTKGSTQGKRIIITQAPAIVQYLVPKDQVEKATITLKRGQEYSLESLVNWLQNNGYTRMENVSDQGEFSRRGNIIDIFPSNEEEAVRLDFLDNIIESIKRLNVNTQRSHKECEDVSLAIGREILLNEENRQRLYAAYQQAFHVSRLDDPTYQKIMDGVYVHGIQYYLPLFYEKTSTLMDYTNNPIIVQSRETASLIKGFLEQSQAYYEARLENKERVLPPERLWLQQRDMENYKTITLNSQISNNAEDIPIPMKSLYLPKSGIAGLKAHVAKNIATTPIVITAQSMGALARLCEESSITQATQIHPSTTPKEAGLYRTILSLPQSIIIGNCEYISATDIQSERKKRILKSPINPQDVIKHIGMIEEGDIVVHETHGIGRYQGMETVTVEGLRHDCLKILYHDGDNLLVPVENIETIGRFGGDAQEIKLDKLGGVGFLKRKAKLKETLRDMAYDLLKVAALRHQSQGLFIPCNTDRYDAFCKKFPHVETQDQIHAIQAIENDFKEGKISDRLICGDVGFGKTEVALRATFLAVDAGYQVAIFTPTTLLANQHYKSFTERFEGTGKTVVQLSRLTSNKSKEIKEKIKNAHADVIIGTHALLGRGLDFPNLGLLIVDEEQNFGVAHKEKIKELKNNIHVLTLTATPIPRTLQMALTGVRDLSIMATPPMERLPVRTITSVYDSLMIKEAILREKQRNGQVFYVCPRLKDLQIVHERLSGLLPDMRVQVVHGQLPASDLEQNMTTFIEGKADILLATNIIESGLDIPNANTIIIHRANMFGLAQLYQLRGRVGRGKIRAFAYCTIEDDNITEQAKKRLEVIQSLDSLGAGFTLAQYDLDMRGAGNLLGDEQSGHIKDIGIDLYQKMLEEEINKAKGLNNQAIEEINVRLTMPIPIYIPEAYISGVGTRMALYRKLSGIKTMEDIRDIKEEMIDRFGEVPEPTENLMHMVLLKEKAKQASIEEIKAGENAIVIKFYNNTVHDVDGLIKFIKHHQHQVKIRSDQHIVYTKESKTASAMFQNITQIIEQLAPLQQKR